MDRRRNTDEGMSDQAAVMLALLVTLLLIIGVVLFIIIGQSY